jgi:PhnB protein
MNVGPYLFFDDKCSDAMKFYETALGGELVMMFYKDIPGGKCPPGMENKVMHAALKKGPFVLLASDMPAEMKPIQGTNVHAIVNCDAAEDVDRFHKSLTVGGSSSQEPHEAFWGARFAVLKDRFGISWMLNFDRNVPKV